MFRVRNLELVNKNTLANQICYGVWCWYSIRMDCISTIVVITAVTFVVLDRTHGEPVLLSLMLQYIMTLQTYSQYTLYMFGEVEK